MKLPRHRHGARAAQSLTPLMTPCVRIAADCPSAPQTASSALMLLQQRLLNMVDPPEILRLLADLSRQSL